MQDPTFALPGWATSAEEESFQNSYCRIAGCGRSLVEWSQILCRQHSLAAHSEVRSVLATVRDAYASDPTDKTPAPALVSFVYYARFGPFIKIGTTQNLRGRMAALKTTQPDWELLAVEPGDRLIERSRHLLFATCRQPRSELFAPTPELQDHIRAVLAQHGPPPV